MASVVESVVINAPVEDVWRILRDFNSHRDWHPAIAESAIEDGFPADAVGAVRRFRLKDGGLLREQLLTLDDRNHALSYCLVEGPIPLFDYVASIRLKPVTDSAATFWEWRSSFRPPHERRDELVALVRDDIYRAGFQALARCFRQRPQPQAPVSRPPPAGASRPLPQAGQETRPAPAVPSGAMRSTGAIVVDRHGGPEVLVPETIDVRPPGPGEVQVRHTAIGVNFIDVYCRTGYFDLLPLPGVPGMEAAGRIEALGPGVTGITLGARVAYACPPVGAYAGLRTMSPELMVPLPDDIEDEVAAAVLLKGVTASFLLHDVHPVGPGDVVVVHAAAGGVGSILTQWATALGAHVVATVSTEDKTELPRQAGAARVVVRSHEDFVSAVRDVTSGRGADVVFDAIGRDTFLQSLDALAVRGHLVSFGQASGPVGSWDIGSFASKSARISRPNYGHYTDTPDKIRLHSERLFTAIRSGAVRVARPASYALSDAARAHRDLESGRTVGSIILLPGD